MGKRENAKRAKQLASVLEIIEAEQGFGAREARLDWIINAYPRIKEETAKTAIAMLLAMVTKAETNELRIKALLDDMNFGTKVSFDSYRDEAKDSIERRISALADGDPYDQGEAVAFAPSSYYASDEEDLVRKSELRPKFDD